MKRNMAKATNASSDARRTRVRGGWLSHWNKMRREAIRRFLARKAEG